MHIEFWKVFCGPVSDWVQNIGLVKTSTTEELTAEVVPDILDPLCRYPAPSDRCSMISVFKP